MDKVAVVILNWNGETLLRRFLPGVLKYTRGAVYVADNASTDASLEVLAREFPDVRTILLDRNYGFAEGYNRALSAVEAEYFVLLNSDVEVKTDWISPMEQYLDGHPGVAACQPKVLNWRQPDCFEYAGAAGGYIDKWGYPYCRGRIFNTVETDNGQYDTVAQVFWATGAALMVRAEVFREVGGLDSRFFAHMEEIDFCWRLRSRGYGIVCIPSAVVYHAGGSTLPKENPRKTYLNFRNNLYMLFKNLPEQQLRKVMCIRRLLDGVAALQFLLKGEWRSAKAIYAAHSDFRKTRCDFEHDRTENLRKAKAQLIPEQGRFSILWSYYVRGCHKFSLLPHK